METDKIFPDNWREIVRGKKVILYNTVVSGMLNNREKQLAKMKWVFQVFKEHNEAVLWWRPHPLEYSTVHSMLPALEEQYLELRRAYQEENIGILDESADLHRAIAVSDAYYGDYSSVMQLYRAAGKPVLCASDCITGKYDELSYKVVDFVVVDRTVWFLSISMNILFAMNLDTFELTDTIEIPHGNALGEHTPYQITCVKGYLVLIPGCGKWIYRFSLKEKHFDELEIGDYSRLIKFSAYAAYNEYVYMIPAYENRLIKYDVLQNKIVDEKKLGEEKNNLLIESITETNGTYFYAVEAAGNHVYKYDMRIDTYEKIQIPGDNIQLFGIKKLKERFLLLLKNKNKILLWDEKENKTTAITGLPEEYAVRYRPLSSVVENKGNIYFFPWKMDGVYKLDMEQMVIEQCSYIENIKEKREDGISDDDAYFRQAKNIGDNIMAFSIWHDQWMIINPQENTAYRRSVIAKEEFLNKMTGYSIFKTDEGMGKQGTLCRSGNKGFYSLHNYIKNVSRCERLEIKNNQNESIGERIYKEIMAGIAI